MQMEKASMSPRGAVEEQKEEVIEVAEMDQKQKGLVVLSGAKWAAIRRLISKHKVDIVCIQETKKESFNKGICQSIWGDSSASWDNVPSVQAAGGLLWLWNNSVYEVERKEKGRNFLMLEGRWVNNNQRMFLVNVYAPCDLAGKRVLWDELKQLRASNPPSVWCFLGDFTVLEAKRKELVPLKELLIPRVSQTSINGYPRWSSRRLSVLVAVLLGLGPMEVSRAGLTDSWFQTSGCLFGLIAVNMSSQGTFLIIAQPF